MIVEKKARHIEEIISGPTRVPDPEVDHYVLDYQEGITYEDGKKIKKRKKV